MDWHRSYGEETLIQTGTEQEYIDGKPIYYAWYELLPDHLVRIRNIQVEPGDMMIASISLLNKNASTWTITIWDVTWNEQFKKNVAYNSSMLSAEWIVERPKVNGAISTMADFGNVTFSDYRVTVQGITATIGNFSFARLIMHEEDVQLVSVSPLYDDEASFTVNYLEPPSPTAPPNDLTIHEISATSMRLSSRMIKSQFERRF